MHGRKNERKFLRGERVPRADQTLQSGVNQYLTGPVFSSRPFQTCQLFSFVDIFLVFGQQEGRASFWGP